MKRCEFNAALKSVSTQGKLDLHKVAALSNEVRSQMVNLIVRLRQPIVRELIPDGFDWAWLHAMGYLYTTRGKQFAFVHTCEHAIR